MLRGMEPRRKATKPSNGAAKTTPVFNAQAFLVNKFKKLGFIEYDGERPLKINSSLLSVVLHD
jgi:hypothetical protein